jgi:two-component system, OmpR family, osmolarity sensor histidine kinase EnvZ
MAWQERHGDLRLGQFEGWKRMWRWRRLARLPGARLFRGAARYLPKRLYARSLIIVIAPMILLAVGGRLRLHGAPLADGDAPALGSRDARHRGHHRHDRDLSAGDNHAEVMRIAQERLNLRVDLLPPDPLPPPGPRPFFGILDEFLSAEISRQINLPFWIDTVGDSNIVEIRVRMEDQVLRVFARRSQTYASNTHIFLLWMVGTSLFLMAIAVAFLRNQIRPITQLAEAAESFGKGRPMPAGFQPRGAEEVRRAGIAFLRMRERIERQIEQRTAMLTGVSHDLRTILTRFKLQLALVGPSAEVEALNQDVDDMQSMLEGYLAFARGEAAEDTGSFDLAACLDRLADEARLQKRELTSELEGPAGGQVRPTAFSRLMSNVVGNALRYAEQSRSRAQPGRQAGVCVDDNGPGIPADRREDVFKPFVRLDEARNQDESGTGLGLSIARDIARSHGGDITLEDSPLGGLRATIRVPA